MTNSPTPHTGNSSKIKFRGAPINPISVDAGHPKLTIRIPSLVHSHYSKVIFVLIMHKVSGHHLFRSQESATTDLPPTNIPTLPSQDSLSQNKDDHRAKRKKFLIRCVQRLASPPPVVFRSLNEEAQATIQRSQSTAGLDLHYALIDMDARFEGEGKKEVIPALGERAFAPETIPSNLRHPTANGGKFQSENDASTEVGIMADDEPLIVASTSSSASSTRQGSNAFMSDDDGEEINPYSSPHPQDEPMTQSSFWSPFSYFPRHLINGPEMTTQAAASGLSASSSPFFSTPPPPLPSHSKALSESLPPPRSDYPTPPPSESPCESPTRIPTFNYYGNSLNKLLASHLDDLPPNAPSVLYEPQARSIGKMKMKTHSLPATLANMMEVEVEEGITFGSLESGPSIEVQSEEGQGSNGITLVASAEEDIIMRDNVSESGSTVSVNVVNRSKQGRESSRNALAEGVMDPDAKVESELCPEEVGVQNEEFTDDEDYVLNHYDLVYPSD
ncbi:hypothetical protein HHX47_DHR4000696 [Lentinula edodes]|nr:hypothetical protein HHX47_DHR4000696 [Lentinula edodes]